jgi:hypothetical protein
MYTEKIFIIGDGGAANSSSTVRGVRFDSLRKKCGFWMENGADVPL